MNIIIQNYNKFRNEVKLKRGERLSESDFTNISNDINNEFSKVLERKLEKRNKNYGRDNFENGKYEDKEFDSLTTEDKKYISDENKNIFEEELDKIVILLNTLINNISNKDFKTLMEDTENIQNLIINNIELIRKIISKEGFEVKSLRMLKSTDDMDRKAGIENLSINILKNNDDSINIDNIKNLLEISNLDDLKDLSNKISKYIENKNLLITDDEKIIIKNMLERLSNEIESEEINGNKITKNENRLEKFIQNDLDIQNDNNSNHKAFKESEDNSNLNFFKVNKDDDLDLKFKSEEKVLDKILNEECMDKLSLFQKRGDFTINNKFDTEIRCIDSMTLKEDFIKSIKFMSTNFMKELTVKVYPKELGAITISLTQSEGTMKAILKSTSKETYSLLVQNSDELKKILGDQNIKVSNVEVSLYNDDTTFYKDGEFSNEFTSGHDDNRNEYVNKENEIKIDTEENTDTKESESEVDILA